MGQEAQEGASRLPDPQNDGSQGWGEERPLMKETGVATGPGKHHRHLSTREPQWHVAPFVKWGRDW